MPAASIVKYLYLAHFSRPEAERQLLRAIRRQRVSTILEVGVGSGRRARRMVEVAQRYTRLGGVSYTGIDLFEARSSQDGAPTIKQMHKLLSPTGARIRLVPGDPFAALARTANDLGGTDLVVFAADQDVDSLVRAWFYVPRMMHPGSLVFVEHRAGVSDAGHCYQLLPLDEIKQLAKASVPRRAA